MKALKGKNRPRPSVRGEDAQRRGLLAKIHIAKKQLGLDDDTYQDMLAGLFGEESSGDLSIGQMEDFLKRFEELGFKGKKRRSGETEKRGQVDALRERAVGIAAELENGEMRLRGLCKKICGADDIRWCNDAGKLKRLLAALEKIRNRG